MGERPIGILVALAEEEVVLAHALAGAREHPGTDGPIREGTIDGRAVVLARTGIGRVAAASVATVLCDRFGARVLLFSGVAGGVAPDLAIGDVVIADRLVDLDYGRREDAGLLRYRPGSLPLPDVPAPADPGFAADPALLA
ncbi:MAG: 5'-methylthioadenosine/adenosylhomocysteine nucleosidase, partial [Chloroflexota bacterium]